MMEYETPINGINTTVRSNYIPSKIIEILQNNKENNLYKNAISNNSN